MIRILLILVLILTFATEAVAQDFSFSRESKVAFPTSPASLDPTYGDTFFGSSAGIALPLGDLGSQDHRNFFSGYAKNGFVVNVINFHQKLNRNFGLGATWSRSQFTSEFGVLAEYYESQINTLDFFADASSDWVVHAAMANFVVNVPHKLIDFDVRIGIGLGRVVRPEILMEGYEKATGYFAYSWQQKETTINDIMWGFGIKARLHVTKSIDVFVQSDYQRMTSTFDVENVYALRFVETEEMTQNFETLSFALGLGFVIH